MLGRPTAGRRLAVWACPSQRVIDPLDHGVVIATRDGERGRVAVGRATGRRGQGRAGPDASGAARRAGADRTPRGRPGPGAGGGPPPEPAADPARADARLAVRLLPRVGGRHGLRPGRGSADLAHVPGVRRRAPQQLRPLRVAGAAAGLRPQRLRRDVDRPVRVGRQTAGGERRARRAGQRLPGEAAARDRRAVRPRLPGGDAHLREPAHAGRLVRPRHRADGRPRAARHPRQEQPQGVHPDHRQGPDARQPRFAAQARRDGRRPAAPGQPTPAGTSAGSSTTGATPPRPRRCAGPTTS